MSQVGELCFSLGCDMGQLLMIRRLFSTSTTLADRGPGNLSLWCSRSGSRVLVVFVLFVCGLVFAVALLLMLSPYDHLTEVNIIVLVTSIIILEVSRGRAIYFSFILRQQRPCLSVFHPP